MPKMPKDRNQLAAKIVAMTTGQPLPKPVEKEKNPAAVALGRLGGEGGAARAANLSPQERSAAAKKAALKRWSKERFKNTLFLRLGYF